MCKFKLKVFDYSDIKKGESLNIHMIDMLKLCLTIQMAKRNMNKYYQKNLKKKLKKKEKIASHSGLGLHVHMSRKIQQVQ